MRFLDTNVVLRYLTRDDPKKAQACYELFQRLQRGDDEVVTTEAIVTDVVYVLSARAHYGLSHEEIRVRLIPILNLAGLKLPGKRLYLRALDIYAAYPRLDFEDAIVVAKMQEQGIATLVSYDTDFDGIPGITREEP